MNIIPVRNKLAYPAGVAPGFDPSHVAARGIVRFSGVCPAPGDFVNLLTGKRGTVVGTRTGGIIGLGGPIACGGQNNAVRFAGNPTIAETSYTVAAIVCCNGTTNGNLFAFSSGSVGSATGMQLVASGNGVGGATIRTVVTGGVGGTSPTYSPIIIGTNPTLIILSRQPGGASNLTVGYCKDLVTGKADFTSFWTDFGYAIAASDGTYEVGGNDNPGSASNAGVMAAMYSNAPISPQEMAAWGEDPWSFWYPRQNDLSFQSLTPIRPTTNRFIPSTRQVVVADPAGAKVIQS